MVDLRVVEPHIAESLKNKYQLKNIEVGIWKDSHCAHYEIISTEGDLAESPIRIRVYDNDEHNNKYYIQCLNYFKDLNAKASSLEEMSNELDEFNNKYSTRGQPITPELASVWDVYADWKDDDITKKFLTQYIECTKKIPQKVYILDAAAATGQTAIYLARKGYKVYANTADDALNEKLIKNVDVSKMEIETKIDPTNYDWALFSHYFKDQKFDIVILIGNFLSRIVDENERQRVIEQCFKILKSGGIFIVDKRNFDRIVKKKNEGKKDICSYHGFNDGDCYKGSVIYRGKTIGGWPKTISNSFIEFVIGNSEKEYSPIFKMYTFKSNTGNNKNDKDELKDLLYRCHFKDVKIYQDYDFNKKIPQGKSDYGDVNADFIVYVAFKNPVIWI